MKTDFCWHIHHGALVEPLLFPIEERIAFIRKYKPAKEIETRLRLMKPVRGTLPVVLTEAAVEHLKAHAEYDKAWVEYEMALAEYVKASAEYSKAPEAWVARVKARAEYEKVEAALGKAFAEYDKVLAGCRTEVEALHALECPDCPWDGTTIFPEEG